MKKERLSLLLTGVAFLGMSVFGILYAFWPKSEAAALYGVFMSRLQEKGGGLEEVAEQTREAENEIQRFWEVYGIDVPLEEMEKQLAIRKDYEAAYKRTYPLEEVFLPAQTDDDQEGDQGEDEGPWEESLRLEEGRGNP